MDYKQLARRAYDIAVANGHYNARMSHLHYRMMIIVEISAIVQSDRRVMRANVTKFKESINTHSSDVCDTADHWMYCYDTYINHTVEDEIADTLIRFLALLHYESAPIPDEKEVLSWKGKTDNLLRDISLPDACYIICHHLTTKWNYTAEMISFIESLASYYYHIDLEWHIEQKMTFNEYCGNISWKRY